MMGTVKSGVINPISIKVRVTFSFATYLIPSRIFCHGESRTAETSRAGKRICIIVTVSNAYAPACRKKFPDGPNQRIRNPPIAGPNERMIPPPVNSSGTAPGVAARGTRSNTATCRRLMKTVSVTPASAAKMKR